MDYPEESEGHVHVDADALPIIPKATFAYRVQRALIRPLMHFFLRVKVHGKDNLPKGAYVAISNHLSVLDGPLLTEALPASPRLHALGDPDAFARSRIKWWFIRTVGGLIPVDRQVHGDAKLRQRPVDALNLGCAILLFPEAKCGPAEGELLPFKKGFAHFSSQANVPIVPIGITGTRSPYFLKRVHVYIGAPIYPEGKDIDTIVNEGAESIRSLMVPNREWRGPKLLQKYLGPKPSKPAAPSVPLASPPAPQELA